MKIEVDQSNKIEEAGDTFLAFSNSIARAIKIPFAVKQKGLQVLRDRGKPKKRARFLLFAVCVFLLLEGHLNRIQKIVVDNEYDGHQVDVKLFLLEYIRKKDTWFCHREDCGGINRQEIFGSLVGLGCSKRKEETRQNCWKTAITFGPRIKKEIGEPLSF